MAKLPAEQIRSHIGKKDGEGQLRHGGEWLAIWSDPDSLKSEARKQAEARQHQAIKQAEQSLAAVVRSLSGLPELTILFQQGHTGQHASATRDAITLPRIEGLPVSPALRGLADIRALGLRYPRGPLSLTSPAQNRIEEILWQGRAVILGIAAFAGVRANILAFHQDQLDRAGLTQTVLASEILLSQSLPMLVLAQLARDRAFLLDQPALVMWDGWLKRQFPGLFDALAQTINQPDDFTGAARRVAASLLPYWHSRSDPDDWQLQHADDEKPGMAERVQMRLDEAGSQSDQGEKPVAGRAGEKITGRYDYRVFSDEFDRVLPVTDLMDGKQLAGLRAGLDTELGKLGPSARRLAGQLARLLASRFRASWQFDEAEGLLDAGRLGRVVTNPLQPLSFKTEQLYRSLDCSVSLLVDNSGSMRGKPVRQAAIAADMIAALLNMAGIGVEVLGFTTDGFRGGQSYRKWVAAGRPANPGRLCDLRHIIYKSFDQPYPQCRDQIAGLFEPTFLGENIDGEAILWAARRLQQTKSAKKLLLVISDGAPADRVSLENNPDADFLARHLNETVRHCHKQAIEVSAIGLNYDISHFYPKALRLDNPESVPPILLEHLASLLARL